MLRIVHEVAKGGAVVRLHGWLRDEEVDEFEKTTADIPLPLSIDLEQLAGVDARGLLALHSLERRGARLIGASPYIELLLERTEAT